MSINSTVRIPLTAQEICSREPIHIPGSIQPHGVLLVLKDPELTCLQVSANWPDLILSDPPGSLPGRSLEQILPLEAARQIREALQGGTADADSLITIKIGGNMFDAVLHRHDEVIIAELEPSMGPPSVTLNRRLQKAMAAMRSSEDFSGIFAIIARFIGEISGYSRVMVYQFDQDWHGQVVGEHLSVPDFGSYLGHHFPASDIPEQARALYVKSWLRIIPEVNYAPAPLVPPLNPITGKPLDLSFSTLRSVSPVHLKYLRNMGVGASMSVSLIIGGKLWGLIACHHHLARRLPFHIRAACELFGQVASLEIASREESRRLGHFAEATRIQMSFFDVIAQEQNFVEALEKYTPRLLEFMSAAGAALHVNGRTTLLGDTPSEAAVGNLLGWLQEQEMAPLYVTDCLGRSFSPASAYQKTGSGLLALRLSPLEFHCLLFFRPEVITSITWAGNPHKPVVVGQTLHPRQSFNAWVEVVRGHSLPWSEVETQGALELRAALNALVLRRTERLISSNEELEKRNTDLHSFAHIAAHDLREPLRGIFQYSQFIDEDFGEHMHAEALRKVRTIKMLAEHSTKLLESLNRFSSLGRMVIERYPVNMEELLDSVLISLGTLLDSMNITIRRPGPLPTIECDPVLAGEVLSNLIINAAKYNTNADPWIGIDFKESQQPGGPPVFQVSDNGIGIPEKHWDVIFTMFRRLHPKDAFGGGTGAGLAIARSIVERHGGHIRVESEPGTGSTFSFTFG